LTVQDKYEKRIAELIAKKGKEDHRVLTNRSPRFDTTAKAGFYPAFRICGGGLKRNSLSNTPAYLLVIVITNILHLYKGVR
jgi:hypothetical protein